MKLLRKLVPLATTGMVALIPLTTTGCSNVYEDLLHSTYLPTQIERLAEDEYSSLEAAVAYLKYFEDHKEYLIPDFYWGASLFARNGLFQDDPLIVVEEYLNHAYEIKMYKDETTNTYRFSFKLKAQTRIRKNTKLDGTGSYSVNTYDLYWEINNLEFYTVYSHVQTDGEKSYSLWTLCPNKYDMDNGVWFDELKGNESIRFEFKAVYKGYSENGAQNYVREANEAAIIDEEHKYVPQLNEVYTNSMLFNSYYLSQAKPRMIVQNVQSPATKESNLKYKTDLTFEFGDNTIANFHEAPLNIKVINKSVSSSANAELESIECEDDLKVPAVGSTRRQNTATIKFKEGHAPNPLDVVYFTVEITEPESGWTEWFNIHTVIPLNE